MGLRQPVYQPCGIGIWFLSPEPDASRRMVHARLEKLTKRKGVTGLGSLQSHPFSDERSRLWEGALVCVRPPPSRRNWVYYEVLDLARSFENKLCQHEFLLMAGWPIPSAAEPASRSEPAQALFVTAGLRCQVPGFNTPALESVLTQSQAVPPNGAKEVPRAAAVLMKQAWSGLLEQEGQIRPALARLDAVSLDASWAPAELTRRPALRL